MLFPVVDLSHQYINGMMYLLTQPAGARPNIVDDRNFYRPAGVKKWVKNGFLNKDIKLPLGAIWSMRTQIEADLLSRTCSWWQKRWDWAPGSMARCRRPC